MDGTTVKITCSSNVGLVVIHHGKKANHRLQQIQVEYIISVPERDAPFFGVSFPIQKKNHKNLSFYCREVKTPAVFVP